MDIVSSKMDGLTDSGDSIRVFGPFFHTSTLHATHMQRDPAEFVLLCSKDCTNLAHTPSKLH